MFVELDPAAGQWIASNADRRWALLLEYWNHLAQRLDRLPKRAEIDPVDLPIGLLPNIFLVDVVRAEAAPPRFRFRLLGAAITARERMRPGQYLDEYMTDKTPNDMVRHYLDCLERRVRVRRTNLAWDRPRSSSPTTSCCCRCRATARWWMRCWASRSTRPERPELRSS